MADEFDPIPPQPQWGVRPEQPGWAEPTRVIPGVVLGARYRIEEFLGRGAAADVYRGLDELLARSVAIKVFDHGVANPDNVALIRAEMQILAKLHHPNLVTVYDARFALDPAAGQPGGAGSDLTYLVLELVDGGTLADRIRPAGMPPVEAARVGAAVASALAAVHQFGLIHRNIKPSNILVSTVGEVKLSDVGITRALDTARAAVDEPAYPNPTLVMGGADMPGTAQLPGNAQEGQSAEAADSAAYLSPEQARGAEVGPPSDVYALGLVLLECLTGRREYPGQPQESAGARLQRTPYVPDTLPGSWPALLRAMTQTDPARRPTAAQVETAASRLAVDVPTPPSPAPVPVPAAASVPAEHKHTSSFGRIFGIVLLVLALAAGLTIAVVAVIRNNEGNDSPGPTTLTVSRTTTPTSLVTTTELTTERTTETSREIIAPTLPTITRPTTDPTTPTTETTPTTPTTPTTSAESAGRNQDSETTTP